MNWPATCEEKVLTPSPGMSVIGRKATRRVTFAENGEVRYVETAVGRYGERRGGCLLSSWQKWCKANHAAEEIPF